MVRVLFVLIFFGIFLSSCSEKIEEDYSTPEATIETFIEAANQWDTEVMANCFEGDFDYWLEHIEKNKDEFKSIYENAEYKMINKTDSSAFFMVKGKGVGGFIDLESNNQWKIVTYKNPVVDPFK